MAEVAVEKRTVLTKQDVNALRQADEVWAMYDPETDEHIIRCSKRRTPAQREAHPFEDDPRYTIPCAGGGISNYGRGGRVGHCYAHVDHDAFGIWQFLRAGDELRLGWGADANTNQYVEKAGLHADTLTISVYRNGKRYPFVADVEVCEDNTARMVRSW